MTRRFENKVAIVTGAASGMGRATALRLAGEGASVFGIDVDPKGLAATEADAKEGGGVMATAVVDVTQRAQCFEAVESAVSNFGRLDVLANVAGIVRFGHSAEIPEQEWNLVMAVNVSGPFFLSQAALPHLIETSGNIVNVASNAGQMGQAYTAAYCASKHALIGLSRSLAMEMMKQKVRVNVIAPGGTDTAMNEGLDIPKDVDWKLIKKFSGMRGFSDPAEIAAAIAFIASDEASSVHGAVWQVDNGMMAG